MENAKILQDWEPKGLVTYLLVPYYILLVVKLSIVNVLA